MIDIDFYMKIAAFKQWIMDGNSFGLSTYKFLEGNRSKKPVVFNIETTNACNMTCPFCPRTTHMTRSIKTMEPKVFERIVAQLEPHPDKLWSMWADFAEWQYKIPQSEQSENAFFLYILPRVVVLHGYGDPLLDPHIPDYVGMMTKRNIPSYFSCNPANIQMDKTERAFGNGLTYIKYSIDSLTDSVRGRDAFAKDYPQIMKVLDMKAKGNYKTQVIITMINLGQDSFDNLKEAFKGSDVYIYQKSLDQSWLTGKPAPKSIHWSEPCQIPWSSMTIKSDGMAASCEEDYNNEIILGDAKTTPLEHIWNGAEYDKLRRNHIYMMERTHCTDGTCDMRVFGRWLK